MPIFSARNGHEPKLLIYFQEGKILEKLLPNEGTMMKVFGVIRSWCKKMFRKIKRWMMKLFSKEAKPGPEEKNMAFFNSAVTVLQTLVIAHGACLGEKKASIQSVEIITARSWRLAQKNMNIVEVVNTIIMSDE